MCGRFEIDPDIFDLKILTGKTGLSLQYKTGEICPCDTAPVLQGNGQIAFGASMIWGFPKWDGKGVIFNARSETAHEKPMFKFPLKQHRVAVPTTGFYEWKTGNSRKKSKYLFTHPSENILWLAGIAAPFGHKWHFTILTTGANDSMAPYHSRMPVLLQQNELDEWINGKDFSCLLERTPHRLSAREILS